MSIWTALAIATLTLAGNAFFVGAEFGLISVRRSKIEIEAAKGSLPAKITLSAMEQVSLMLAGAQLGVTICSLIFGAVSEPLTAHLLEQIISGLGLSEALVVPAAIFITLMLMSYLHVVIGEMVPKNLALAAPVKVALFLIPPLVLFVNTFKPIIILLNSITIGILKSLGFQPKQEMTSSFSRDEVAGFIKESLRDGLLSLKEEQLLSGSLNFDDVMITSVIIPLNMVIFASSRPTPTEIEKLISTTGFSRYPILGKHGQIKEYIHAKDILRISDANYDEPLAVNLLRPLTSVKSTSTLKNALAVMQHSGSHLSKVTNVDNEVIGIIALEDVLEELVGEIRDDTRK
jgi:CBS domain containing-hemolysin-like protein